MLHYQKAKEIEVYTVLFAVCLVMQAHVPIEFSQCMNALSQHVLAKFSKVHKHLYLFINWRGSIFGKLIAVYNKNYSLFCLRRTERNNGVEITVDRSYFAINISVEMINIYDKLIIDNITE